MDSYSFFIFNFTKVLIDQSQSHVTFVFFNLLEVNAQILALKNKIATRLDKEHGPMQERYERLHFNVANGLDAEREYFQYIYKQVLKSFDAYQERMRVVICASDRLNQGISQLRDDFDSNTNVILQLLMFFAFHRCCGLGCDCVVSG